MRTGATSSAIRPIGEASAAQLSVGFQFGAQGDQQIVFFEDERALKAGASGGQRDATAVGKYCEGMATFTVPQGDFMDEASIAGQISFKRL